MSKFDKIFKARESENNKAAPIKTKDPAVKNAARGKNKTAGLNSTIAAPKTSDETPDQSSPVKSSRGRPAAKRSNPDFVGLTTYIRRDTHTRAKIALLQAGDGKELSELVEELIGEWLVGQKA